MMVVVFTFSSHYAYFPSGCGGRWQWVRAAQHCRPPVMVAGGGGGGAADDDVIEDDEKGVGQRCAGAGAVVGEEVSGRRSGWGRRNGG